MKAIPILEWKSLSYTHGNFISDLLTPPTGLETDTSVDHPNSEVTNEKLKPKAGTDVWVENQRTLKLSDIMLADDDLIFDKEEEGEKKEETEAQLKEDADKKVTCSDVGYV